jgi:hypothetical protein
MFPSNNVPKFILVTESFHIPIIFAKPQIKFLNIELKTALHKDSEEILNIDIRLTNYLIAYIWK